MQSFPVVFATKATGRLWLDLSSTAKKSSLGFQDS